jgi:hypothetical protein
MGMVMRLYDHAVFWYSGHYALTGRARDQLVGKSWIACALAHKACRDDRSVLY